MTENPNPNPPAKGGNLTRYYRSIRRLARDLDKSIHLMNMYKGLGDVAVRTYTAIYKGVVQQTDDPFLEALALPPFEDDTSDKQKVVIVNMLVGQLLAYLESELEAE